MIKMNQQQKLIVKIRKRTKMVRKRTMMTRKRTMMIRKRTKMTRKRTMMTRKRSMMIRKRVMMIRKALHQKMINQMEMKSPKIIKMPIHLRMMTITKVRINHQKPIPNRLTNQTRRHLIPKKKMIKNHLLIKKQTIKNLPSPKRQMNQPIKNQKKKERKLKKSQTIKLKTRNLLQIKLMIHLIKSHHPPTPPVRLMPRIKTQNLNLETIKETLIQLIQTMLQYHWRSNRLK
jgi:hypothetical protein